MGLSYNPYSYRNKNWEIFKEWHPDFVNHAENTTTMSKLLDQLKREFSPTHIHRYYPNRFSMQIIEETNRGFKTLIKEGNTKPKVQFFYNSDISGDRRIFDPIKASANN